MENADYVLFVSANISLPQCAPGGATLAFAAPCQLEMQYDRCTCIIYRHTYICTLHIHIVCICYTCTHTSLHAYIIYTCACLQ